MLRRRPPAGPHRDRGGGGTGQARDRHGPKGSGRGGRGAAALGGGRVRAPGRRRSASRRRPVTVLLGAGVMSGTSLDGVSTALVRLADAPFRAELLAFHQEPYSAAERGAIVDAIARAGAKDLALLHVAL